MPQSPAPQGILLKRQRSARDQLFACPLYAFLEDFNLHRLLAQDSLQPSDPLLENMHLRSADILATRRYRHLGAFALKLHPANLLARGDAVLARHVHPCCRCAISREDEPSRRRSMLSRPLYNINLRASTGVRIGAPLGAAKIFMKIPTHRLRLLTLEQNQARAFLFQVDLRCVVIFIGHPPPVYSPPQPFINGNPRAPAKGFSG